MPSLCHAAERHISACARVEHHLGNASSSVFELTLFGSLPPERGFRLVICPGCMICRQFFSACAVKEVPLALACFPSLFRTVPP